MFQINDKVWVLDNTMGTLKRVKATVIGVDAIRESALITVVTESGDVKTYFNTGVTKED